MIEYTHAIITADNVMSELVNPDGMTLTVPAGASAIAKAQLETWMTTFGDLNAVCLEFGWVNLTGVNLTV